MKAFVYILNFGLEITRYVYEGICISVLENDTKLSEIKKILRLIRLV